MEGLNGSDGWCDSTPEYRMLRETVRKFARERVAPQAEEQDEKGHLNIPLFREVGDLGVLGVTVPEADGGAGLDTTAAVIITHELAKADAGFAMAYAAHAVLFVSNFNNSANAEQRKKYLPKSLTGEWIGALCMTEPGAGTDLLGMTSRAVRQGDSYILDGSKMFITNGPEAALFFLYAKVNDRITSFVVERGFRGVEVGLPIPKVGMRSSSMAEVRLDHVPIPVENLLGQEGEGLKHMMRNLEVERLVLSAISLGIADRCLEVMVKYAGERKAFGKTLNQFGQIQRHIAESYAKTEAMRALIYRVARSTDQGKQNRLDTDAAKLFSSTAAKEVADSAIQVLGGYGYCREYQVERFWRDAKLLEIGGGTVEAHQKNITKDLSR
ncbi:MAG: acyl-CoA dehydrogenase family protein [Pseudomonadota bacterium]